MFPWPREPVFEFPSDFQLQDLECLKKALSRIDISAQENTVTIAEADYVLDATEISRAASIGKMIQLERKLLRLIACAEYFNQEYSQASCRSGPLFKTVAHQLPLVFEKKDLHLHDKPTSLVLTFNADILDHILTIYEITTTEDLIQRLIMDYNEFSGTASEDNPGETVL